MTETWYAFRKNGEVVPAKTPYPDADFEWWVKVKDTGVSYSTPSIYDEQVYEFAFYDGNVNETRVFSNNGWTCSYIKDAENFRESGYVYATISDPHHVTRTFPGFGIGIWGVDDVIRKMKHYMVKYNSWDEFLAWYSVVYPNVKQPF